MKIGVVLDTLFSGVNEVVSGVYYIVGLYSHTYPYSVIL
jgi:hypothetical protein